MTSNPISEIYPPREGSWKSIGKIPKSRHNGSDSPYENPEYNTWKKEYTSWGFDMIAVFVEFSSDNSSEDCSSNGF